MLRGASTYIYDGNWKLQTENGADGYHVSRRALELRRHHRPAHAAASRPPRPRPWTPASWAKQGGGFYSFENGHLLLWTDWANPEDRPLWHKREELVAEFGQARADWMLKSRATCASTRTST